MCFGFRDLLKIQNMLQSSASLCLKKGITYYRITLELPLAMAQKPFVLLSRPTGRGIRKAGGTRIIKILKTLKIKHFLK